MKTHRLYELLEFFPFSEEKYVTLRSNLVSAPRVWKRNLLKILKHATEISVLKSLD